MAETDSGHPPVYSIDIDPIDPLIFGDNRMVRAGYDHLILDQDPSPLLIHGVLGQWILERYPSGWPDAVLGPREADILKVDRTKKHAELLGYCYRDCKGGFWFSKPLHFRCTEVKERLLPHDLLAPQRVDVVTTASSCAFDRILDGETIEEYEQPVLVSQDVLKTVLQGIPPSKLPLQAHQVMSIDQVFRHEFRAGVVVDNTTGTVQEGMLFTRPYRRFAPAPIEHQNSRMAFGIAAWLRTVGGAIGDPAASSQGRLGGEGRRALFNFSAIHDLPFGNIRDGILAKVSGSSGFLAYLLTPAVAPSGPITISGCQAVAAAIGKPVYASGWNSLSGQPRPLQNLIPAGSVFFFDWPHKQPDPAVVADNWLTSLSLETAHVGFGRVLIGVWK